MQSGTLYFYKFYGRRLLCLFSPASQFPIACSRLPHRVSRVCKVIQVFNNILRTIIFFKRRTRLSIKHILRRGAPKGSTNLSFAEKTPILTKNLVNIRCFWYARQCIHSIYAGADGARV